MKYAIIACVNGNFSVKTEWSDLEKAKANYHGICQTHWSAPDVITCEIAIVDEQLDIVEGYKEYIHHDPAPVVVPEETPVETPEESEETPTEEGE